ncbi:MAG: GCN5-related N-acetyltransferase [Caulobacteraceae bacterium]|nr:GCN5-related N-acetyltransferase [Caulobacteraceae bacterium]
MPNAAALAATPAVAPLIAPERAQDTRLVEGLIDRAFGPGRFAKTAERLRERQRPDLGLSFVAWGEGRAVGCVRQWPILIGDVPAVLLGPIAVQEDRRREGLGASLILRACDAARDAGYGAILLVGDEALFGPYGFSAAAASRVTLPGPVDQRRVLARALGSGAAAALSGPVRPIAA